MIKMVKFLSAELSILQQLQLYFQVIVTSTLLDIFACFLQVLV